MGIILRACLAVVTAASTYYFIFWLAGAALFAVGVESRWPRVALALICVALSGSVVWRGTSQTPTGPAGVTKGPRHAMLLGAIIVGAVGFAAGFFGPIVFARGANQGPILGLFITGPLGLVAGAFCGWVWWVRNGSQGPGNEDAA